MTPSSLHILLVDDDPRFRELTGQALDAHGIATSQAGNGAEAIRMLLDPATPELDLVLLDIMMPESTGWDVLAAMRQHEIEVPVIVVTARESVEERVRGLHLGADDYIIKPFAFSELLARIEAVVRRRTAVPHLRFGALQLDPMTRRVRFADKAVDLSPKEFDLLRVLMEQHGAVSSRSEILANVWNTKEDPGTNLVEVHIGRLRRKLESVGCLFLATVRGQGYLLQEPDA